MISMLINTINKHKKLIIIFLLIILVFFLLWDIASAGNTGTATPPETTKNTNFWVSAIQWISGILAFLMSIISGLVTLFLSPEWYNGSIFKMTEIFRSIWVMVSNVVYIAFAFILIWIAFMNIIGRWDEKYQLKQALPKFIIWILIVPFSWFFVQFILSMSAILTIAAINLPYETFQNSKNKLNQMPIPKECTLNLSSVEINELSGIASDIQSGMSWASQGTTSWSGNLNKMYSCDKENMITVWDLLNSSDSTDNIYWVIGTYIHWILDFESVFKIAAEEIGKIERIWDLVVKWFFDLVFGLVYITLIVTIWLVLMVRWIYIWIYIMLSPLFGLMYFFDKTSDWFFWDFSIKNFISLALVPVYTMLALSFGLLFLNTVSIWLWENNPRWWWEDNKTIGTNTQDNQEDYLQIWQFKFKFVWLVSSPNGDSEFFTTLWSTTLWQIWAIILKIMGIVVLWWTIMAALRTNKITEALVEPIYNFWKQVWSVAKSLPQYAPILPGGWSMKSFETYGGLLESWLRWYGSKQGEELWWKYWFGDEYGTKMWKIKREMEKNPSSWYDQLNWIAKGFKEMDWKIERLTDSRAQDLYKTFLNSEYFSTHKNLFDENKKDISERINNWAATEDDIAKLLNYIREKDKNTYEKVFKNTKLEDWVQGNELKDHVRGQKVTTSPWNSSTAEQSIIQKVIDPKTGWTTGQPEVITGIKISNINIGIDNAKKTASGINSKTIATILAKTRSIEESEFRDELTKIWLDIELINDIIEQIKKEAKDSDKIFKDYTK